MKELWSQPVANMGKEDADLIKYHELMLHKDLQTFIGMKEDYIFPSIAPQMTKQFRMKMIFCLVFQRSMALDMSNISFSLQYLLP